MDGSGKEGDSILLMALGHIGCSTEVHSISDIVSRPELLVSPTASFHYRAKPIDPHESGRNA